MGAPRAGRGDASGDGTGRGRLRPAGWLADLTGFLLPAGCVACGDWIPGGSEAPLVCGRCRSRFKQAPWPRCPRCHFPTGTGRSAAAACRACAEWPRSLCRARYAFELREPVSDLVHALKYEGWRELAETMGQALARAYRAPGGRAIVTWVPTTEARVRRRGYNQAMLLARAYAARSNQVAVRVLLRRSGGASQTALHPSERRANVERAFGLAEGAATRCRGAHVVLVDDVLTTGATACAAAETIAAAGPASVTLLAFARAIPKSPRNGP